MKTWKIAGGILGSTALLALGLAAAALGTSSPTTTHPTTTGGGHTPVTICHKPGTPAEHELVVDDDSVELTGHLGHGDTIGPCGHTPPPVDVCPNLEGDQATVPPGYHLVEGENGHSTCVKDEEPPPTTTTTPETPRCPPGMVPTGGKDGHPGNDECEFPKTTTTPPSTTTTPPPTTPTPPTITTPTPPVVTPPPATQPPAAKPPKAKPPAKPKPKPKPKPPTKTGHVCKTLKDGTPRRWYDGGNGMKPGCYAIIQGSG